MEELTVKVIIYIRRKYIDTIVPLGFSYDYMIRFTIYGNLNPVWAAVPREVACSLIFDN